MKKIVGFEAWEIVSIGLVNVTECERCGRLINFNGLTPKFCLSCDDKLDPYFQKDVPFNVQNFRHKSWIHYNKVLDKEL